MSENGEQQESIYVTKDQDGNVKIQEDGYITESTINDITFTFDKPKEITESTADKNRNKPTVSFTKKGRAAYSPGTINYLDGMTSANMVIAKCIFQHTEALNAAKHNYAKNFVNAGIPEIVIDKIIADAKNNSNINLNVKENVENMNQYYWLRCNLDKLTRAKTHILLEAAGVTVEMELDKLLIEFGKSVIGYIVFTLSASMNNDNMDEELDLEDGQYYITMKPTEAWIVSGTDIEGPKLANTNARKNEGAEPTGHFYASGKLAEFAMKKLKVNSK